MLSMSIKITGDAKIMRKLNTLRNLNFTEANKEIGKELVSYYQSDSFASAGTNLGKKWPALSPAYKKYKTKKYGSARVLIASGKMQKSFFAKVTKSSIIIDNKASYYKYHQSTAARSIMPRRQMAGINKHVKDIVRTAIIKDINKKLNK